MPADVQAFQFLLGHLSAGLVLFGVELGGDGEPGGSVRSGDVFESDLVTP